MKKLGVFLLIAVVIGLPGCSKEMVPENNKPETEQTSPKNDNMGDVKNNSKEGKEEVQKLHEDLDKKFNEQKLNFQKDSWEKFSNDFTKRKDTIKKNIKENEYLSEAILNLEKLFEEYNNSLKNNIEVGKEKVEDFKNKIEENLNKIK